jgi:hypothetical protein
LLVNNSIFLVEQPNVVDSASNLVRVDLSNQSKPTELFPTLRKGLVSLIELSGPDSLAVSEEGASQVLLLDPKSSQLTSTIPVAAGTPRGLAQLGNCLVVGSEASRKVSFYSLKTSPQSLVATWDLSGAGQSLMGIRDLAVDPASGTVYVRSAYACVPMQPCPPRNSVWLADDSTGATLAACQQ